MTYTYTGPSSDMEKVRLRIGDTGQDGVLTSTTAIFSDEEIAYFVTEAGTVIAAAIMALRTIVASKVLLVKRAKLEGYEIEEFAMADLLKAIESLEEESAGGGLEVGELAIMGEHLDSFAPQWLPDEDTGAL